MFKFPFALVKKILWFSTVLSMNMVNGCYVMIIEFLKLILSSSDIGPLVTYCFMYWTRGVDVWWVSVLVLWCMHNEGL